MRWLLDEMLPPACASKLGERGHDAKSILTAGLPGADDAAVFEYAVAESRVLVTENFTDFAQLVDFRQSREQACVPVVFVRRADLPRRGALAMHLANKLTTWAAACPDPYVGLHWP